MTKKQRIINALDVLKSDAPELYDGIVNGDCPHEAGLMDVRLEQCGSDDTDRSFVMGFCAECWRLAMEGTK